MGPALVPVGCGRPDLRDVPVRRRVRERAARHERDPKSVRGDRDDRSDGRAGYHDGAVGSPERARHRDLQQRRDEHREFPCRLAAVGAERMTLSRRQWAGQLLAAGGFPVRDEAVEAIAAWIGGENTACAANPLATEHPGPGSIQCPLVTTASVQAFPTYQAGIAATLAALNLNFYVMLRYLLRVGGTDAIVAEVARSRWGTGSAAVAALSALRARPALGDLPVPPGFAEPAPPPPSPDP